MNPWAGRPGDGRVHLPRPGHADLVGIKKYKDSGSAQHPRAGLRARDRRARRRRRRLQGVPGCARRRVHSHVVQIAEVALAVRKRPCGWTTSPTWTPGPCAAWTLTRARRWCARSRLRKSNESLGGVFEVHTFGLVPGLGSHVSWEERLDGRLAMAICSIQAIKGVHRRRRLRDRRPARAHRRTTRSSIPPSGASTARPTAREVWRAG